MKQQSRQSSSFDGNGNGKAWCSRRDKIIKKIAIDVLGIKTLEERNRDGLDFYDGDDGMISVWDLKEALQRAYAAGHEHGLKTKAETQHGMAPDAMLAELGQIVKNVTFLGTTTLRRMLDAVYNKNDPLYERNIFSECMAASIRVEEDPSNGDEAVYVYYHRKENQTIMTNIEGDVMGAAGSSAGFKGKVVP